MRQISKLSFAAAVALGALCAVSAQETAIPPLIEQVRPLPAAADWRERIQKNRDATQSIEQQVRRLTRDLELTPEQQEKVRQLSKKHSDRIQKILDSAPPTLSYEAFRAQVHAISQDYHDEVTMILTPRQLGLAHAMVDRLDRGEEDRRVP